MRRLHYCTTLSHIDSTFEKLQRLVTFVLLSLVFSRVSLLLFTCFISCGFALSIKIKIDLTCLCSFRNKHFTGLPFTPQG